MSAAALYKQAIGYSHEVVPYVRSLPERYRKLKFGTKVFIWCASDFAPPPPPGTRSLLARGRSLWS
jgi:hypothetical protein